ncbi:MAG: ribosome maturation factor RimP [Alphaproteobacteria bacterium]|nr:ribosome maturation factor RimP [Alphaproteobacteria bacterium]
MQRYERLEELVIPVLTDMGYDLVRLSMHGGDSRQVLQIMAERKDLAAMTIDDCSNISRELSAVLDVADPISGRYSLEISSPGLDRPLMKPADFRRFQGFAAKVETEVPVDGAKRFKGKITGVSDADDIEMAIEDKGITVHIPFSVISKAKLIITDELINAVTKGNKGF